MLLENYAIITAALILLYPELLRQGFEIKNKSFIIYGHTLGVKLKIGFNGVNGN